MIAARYVVARPCPGIAERDAYWPSCSFPTAARATRELPLPVAVPVEQAAPGKGDRSALLLSRSTGAAGHRRGE